MHHVGAKDGNHNMQVQWQGIGSLGQLAWLEALPEASLSATETGNVLST